LEEIESEGLFSKHLSILFSLFSLRRRKRRENRAKFFTSQD